MPGLSACGAARSGRLQRPTSRIFRSGGRGPAGGGAQQVGPQQREHGMECQGRQYRGERAEAVDPRGDRHDHVGYSDEPDPHRDEAADPHVRGHRRNSLLRRPTSRGAGPHVSTWSRRLEPTWHRADTAGRNDITTMSGTAGPQQHPHAHYARPAVYHPEGEGFQGHRRHLAAEHVHGTDGHSDHRQGQKRHRTDPPPHVTHSFRRSAGSRASV
jgi:hypothetical protein